MLVQLRSSETGCRRIIPLSMSGVMEVQRFRSIFVQSLLSQHLDIRGTDLCCILCLQSRCYTVKAKQTKNNNSNCNCIKGKYEHKFVQQHLHSFSHSLSGVEDNKWRHVICAVHLPSVPRLANSHADTQLLVCEMAKDLHPDLAQYDVRFTIF